MPRVKKSVKTHKRRKKILDAAKGYRGSRRRLYRIAADTVDRGRKFAYRDRRTKKRTFRSLWITRINAAARSHDITYNRLISGLNKAQVEIDRKILAQIAYSDPAGFAKIVEIAKGQLA